jgi:hypothetical protein
MPLVHNDSNDLVLYARFDNAGNTAIDFTQGTTLKKGRYEILDSAIVTAGIVAGDYAVRVFVGTAAGQLDTDELRGVISFSWSGSAEITLRSLSTQVSTVNTTTSAIASDVSDIQDTQLPAISTTVNAINTSQGTQTTSLNSIITTQTAHTTTNTAHTNALNSIQADTNDIQATLAGFDAGGLSGPGADEVTLVFEESGSGDPIADADVWITNDQAGNNVIAGTKQTNSQGEVTFMLDDGVVYYRWMQRDGVEAVMGQQFTAEAD